MSRPAREIDDRVIPGAWGRMVWVLERSARHVVTLYSLDGEARNRLSRQ